MEKGEVPLNRANNLLTRKRRRRRRGLVMGFEIVYRNSHRFLLVTRSHPFSLLVTRTPSFYPPFTCPPRVPHSCLYVVFCVRIETTPMPWPAKMTWSSRRMLPTLPRVCDGKTCFRSGAGWLPRPSRSRRLKRKHLWPVAPRRPLRSPCSKGFWSTPIIEA